MERDPGGDRKRARRGVRERMVTPSMHTRDVLHNRAARDHGHSAFAWCGVAAIAGPPGADAQDTELLASLQKWTLARILQGALSRARESIAHQGEKE